MYQFCKIRKITYFYTITDKKIAKEMKNFCKISEERILITFMVQAIVYLSAELELKCA